MRKLTNWPNLVEITFGGPFGQFRISDTLVTFVAAAVVAVIVRFVLQINSQMSVLEVALSTAKGEI